METTLPLTIRPMLAAEAEQVAALIRRTLLEVNSKDYGYEAMVDYAAGYGPEKVLAITAQGGHSYVAYRGEELVACGSIGPWNGSETESIVLAFYVLPERQGQGLGARLLARLEQDECFLRAERVVVSASITAHRFYQKHGYDYLNGVMCCEDHDHYWMEKRN